MAAKNNTLGCIPQERQALLYFKQGISYDDCGLLDSWTDQRHNQDCCRWDGVGCDDNTCYVISIDLSGCFLEGNISNSLLKLKYLRHLDLTGSRFAQPIPRFIGSLHSLKSLNLSHASFEGEIPARQLANLSRLTSLDLSYNNYYGHNSLYAKSLGWLSNLTLLREINFCGVDLSKATDWMLSINNLPRLRFLHMDACGLPPPILSSSFFNTNSTSSLQILTLSGSYLNDSHILHWIFSSTRRNPRLEYVDISDSCLIGPFPMDFQIMGSLSYLDLSNNKLEGAIPDAIFAKMEALSYLDLSRNNLSAQIPGDFHNMSFLSHLDLSYNKLEGPIPNAIFTKMPNLSFLDLSHNSLAAQIPNDFQVMSSLTHLGLSNNKLEGPIPNAMFPNMQALTHLDLSYNSLNGTIPDSLASLPQLTNLDLSANYFEGVMPPFLGELKHLSFVDLSWNCLHKASQSQLVNFSLTYFDQRGDSCQEPSSQIDEVGDSHPSEETDKGFYKVLYISLADGFYVGLWAFFGTLAFKDSWRHRYFQFLEHVINKVYVIVAIQVAKFQRNHNDVPN